MAGTDTKLIIGGVILIGGALYLFKDKIGGLFDGLTKVSDTASDTLSDNLELLNIKKDIGAIGDFLNQAGSNDAWYKKQLENSQQQISDLSNKNQTLMQDVANRQAAQVTYFAPSNKSSNVSIANPKNSMGLPTTIKSTTTGQTIQNPFSFENLSNVSLSSGKTGIAGRTGIVSYI